MKSLFSFFLVWSILLLAPGARAATPLSVAAGIAAPSSRTALFENPAGLIDQNGTSAGVFVHVPNDDLDYPTLGGILNYGTRSFALAGGVQHRSFLNHSTTDAIYGLALKLGEVDLGLSGSTGISPSSSPGGFNLGLLLGGHSRTKFGLLIAGIDNDNRTLGAGFAFPLGSGVLFATDFGSDDDFSNMGAKPGLSFSLGSAALSVNYGFTLIGAQDAAPLVTDGFSAGLGLKLGSATALTAHYEHINKYFVELSFSI